LDVNLVQVPTSQRPWPRGKKFISINNFGFGGTNAHAVLEKAPPMPKPVTNVSTEAQFDRTGNPIGPIKRLYVLSANDKASLETQMQQLTIYLEQRPEVFQNSLLPNLAYTLGQRRSVLSWRVAIPARSSAELIPSLARNLIVPSRATKEPKIGFIFTGQGAQWHAMGRELFAYPIFAKTIEKFDLCLMQMGSDFSVTGKHKLRLQLVDNVNILAEELSKDAETSRVSDAHISQPACTAVQLALTDLFKSWGIRPAAVAGHSSGEIGAAYAAGALTLEDCAAIAYYRGQAIVSLKKQFPDLKGAMMAVGVSPDELRPILKLLREGRATAACINSPSSVTVSGDEDAISELQDLMEQKQMFNRKLRVNTAYHSHHMNLVAEEYGQNIRTVNSLNVSQTTFHSSLFGRISETDVLDASYWVQNLTCLVRFSDALQSMCGLVDDTSASGVDVLVEIGPHAALEGPVKQTLKSIGGNAVKLPYASALHRNRNAVDTAVQLAATMFMKGTLVNFAAINFPVAPQKAPTLLTNLPKYPWAHSTRYWHESRIADKHKHREFPRNDLVGTLAAYSNDLEPTWRNIIRADDVPWVRHHKMQSMTVYPMAGYIAMALEASAQRAVMRNVAFDKFELREVTVSRPLAIHEGADVEVSITLRAYTEGTRSLSDTWDEFRIFSWAKDRSWIDHCRGLISVQKSIDNNAVNGAQQILDGKTMLISQMASIIDACTSPVKPSEMYDALTAKGAGYGPTFQGLENCTGCDNHAVADLIVPDTKSTMPMGHEPDFIIHPAFLDQFIQIVWPILGAGRSGLNVLYMPSFVQSMSISTGITRQAGDRLRVYGTGYPTPANASPTKLSLFATTLDGGNEALISMDSLVMTPVFDGPDAMSSVANRGLCYKLQWEAFPLEDNTEMDIGAPPPSLTKRSRGDFESTTGAGVQGEKRRKGNGGDVVSNGLGNRSEYLHASGTNDSTTPKSELQVAIICDEGTQHSLVSSVRDLVSNFTKNAPTIGVLGKVQMEGKICIVLSELVGEIISNLNATDFQTIQKMTSSAVGILWVVRGAYTDSTNPHGQMVIGMARSIRSETLLKFATLDMGTLPQLSETGTAEKIFEVFKSTFASDASPVSLDMEFQERDGKLLVPRVIEDSEINKFVHQETQPSAAPDLQPFAQKGRPLKISIETPGALDTLYFTDDLVVGTPLPEYEVEIEVKATSMNFKDIMISMGQLSSKYIGVECSGVISAVGSKVTDLSAGDRVCAMSEGAYSTYTRCLGTSVQKIPDSMPFEDAATIPVIYCTAYYSLFDLGRLVEGESVLIHAAAGGVGQAAIILCKTMGVEIFATVGSVAKKEFIMSEYGIPEDHIFYSRNTSFAKAVKRATNSQGVDLVLNSLAGDQLRETWDSLAHFGRFIEIGKRDIVGNTRLEMARFEHNALFASVDLTVVAAERPKIMKRLLSDVFDLMARGLAKPIAPITIFPMLNIESAFRALQGGKTMGKIVMVPKPDDVVKAVPSKTKTLLKANATYVIIGGTGGLGRSMSRWMIEKGARNILLVSRSGNANKKVGELVEEAKEAGAQIVVRPCDVTKKEQVEKLVTQGIPGMPAIRGVIHAAMVLRVVLNLSRVCPQLTKIGCSLRENDLRAMESSGSTQGFWGLELPPHPPLRTSRLLHRPGLSSRCCGQPWPSCLRCSKLLPERLRAIPPQTRSPSVLYRSRCRQ
jgi:acyl transferase domain-containing protein/NADPH:quinone reductase-like Zn-dependent oxidoreductase